MDLFDYQKQDAEWLASRRDALVASEMGTGKTATLIAGAARINAGYVLVVCPAIARSVWEREWSRWATTSWHVVRLNSEADISKKLKSVPLARTVVIAGYDLFSRKERGSASAIRKALLRLPQFDLIIADECHYLKNIGSNRTKEVFKLYDHTARFWAASGTPAPNHAGELFPLLSTCFPDAIGNMDKIAFEATYCNVKTMWINGREIQTISGSKNTDSLRKLLVPHMVRRMKKDVLSDLPPMLFDTLPLEGAVSQPGSVNETALLSLGDDDLLKALAADKVHFATQRRATGLAKVTMCVEWIMEMLEPDPSKKIVVFAVHHDVIDRLMEMLKQLKPVKIDGRDGPNSRLASEDAFQKGGARVFVGQIQAAGTSLTLTASSEVLFVESDWVPGNNLQAASRCHRIGQTLPVTARHAVLAGSLDERIGEALARKEQELVEIFG
jgi:SWI/SNF-related matrix-associated actin-dependent regulator 1 of chromatin subfamily A